MSDELHRLKELKEEIERLRAPVKEGLIDESEERRTEREQIRAMMEAVQRAKEEETERSLEEALKRPTKIYHPTPHFDPSVWGAPLGSSSANAQVAVKFPTVSYTIRREELFYSKDRDAFLAGVKERMIEDFYRSGPLAGNIPPRDLVFTLLEDPGSMHVKLTLSVRDEPIASDEGVASPLPAGEIFEKAFKLLNELCAAFRKGNLDDARVSGQLLSSLIFSQLKAHQDKQAYDNARKGNKNHL